MVMGQLFTLRTPSFYLITNVKCLKYHQESAVILEHWKTKTREIRSQINNLNFTSI